MKVLITGGNGRIGRYLREKIFVNDFVISVSTNNDAEIETSKYIPYSFDILNKQRLTEVFEEHKPEIVIHLAALMGPNCEENPERCKKINVEATELLASIAEKYGTKRFVFASSSSVYSQTILKPIKETDIPNPENAYGESKLLAEELLKKYSTKNMQVIVLRMFNIYGNEFPESLIMRLTNSTESDPVELIVPEKFYRDYIHIDEVGKAFSNVCNSKKLSNYEIINIASGKATSTKELLSILSKNGLTPHYRIIANPSIKFSYSWADITKMRELL